MSESLMKQFLEDGPEFRSQVEKTEQFMKDLPQLTIEVEHEFADGMYRRKAIAPKDSVIVTRVHKRDNFAFIMTGEVTILSEQGATRVKAPFSFITRAGTKRVLLAHEESIWFTVHNLPDTLSAISDIEDIENYFSCDTLEEYERSFIGEQKKVML